MKKLPENLEVNKGDDGYYVEEKGKPGEGAFGFGPSPRAAIADYFLARELKKECKDKFEKRTGVKLYWSENLQKYISVPE